MYLVYSFRFGEIKKKKRKKKEAKVVSKKYTMGGGGDPFFRVDLHSGTYAGRRKIYKLEWVLRSREKNEKRWIITRNVHVSFFEHAASFFHRLSVPVNLHFRRPFSPSFIQNEGAKKKRNTLRV